MLITEITLADSTVKGYLITEDYDSLVELLQGMDLTDEVYTRTLTPIGE